MPNVRAKGTRAKENFAFGGKDKPKNTATQTSQESSNTNTDTPQNTENTYKNNLFNRLFKSNIKQNKDLVEEKTQRIFQENLRGELKDKNNEVLDKSKNTQGNKQKPHEEELGR